MMTTARRQAYKNIMVCSLFGLLKTERAERQTVNYFILYTRIMYNTIYILCIQLLSVNAIVSLIRP